MKRLVAICALASVVLAAGCGGGGSGSGAATGSGRATVLLTDSVREDFAHVWTTIYKVELVSDSGSTVALFDDTSGRQIDLKTLRDASGERFSFLGSASIPEGTYTGVKVTIAETMQLFKNGAAVGDPLSVDDSIAKDASVHPVVSFTFKKPKTVGATATNIVVDFDLAHFIVRESKVLPALQEGEGAGMNNHERHNADHYRGTVSGLTGTSPDLTFTLNRGPKQTVTVTTSAATALYGTGSLIVGSVVEVQGTLDPATQTLVATQVEVTTGDPMKPGTDAPRDLRFSGTASTLDATAGTFTLTPSEARGCMPSQTTVSVVTTSTTEFRADNGDTQTAEQFFTAAATTSNVAVSGTFDSATNTLTATKVKIVDTTQDGGWHPAPQAFRKGTDRQNWGHGVLRP